MVSVMQARWRLSSRGSLLESLRCQSGNFSRTSCVRCQAHGQFPRICPEVQPNLLSKTQLLLLYKKNEPKATERKDASSATFMSPAITVQSSALSSCTAPVKRKEKEVIGAATIIEKAEILDDVQLHAVGDGLHYIVIKAKTSSLEGC